MRFCLCAASQCSMALRVSSAVPFPLSLSALSLIELSPGWALTATSTDSLDDEPHSMSTGDVYAAVFALCTPVATGASSIGSLRYRCRRLPEESAAAAEDAGGVTAASNGAMPEVVREIVFQEREIVQPLPQICVCSRMVEAWFRVPPQVALRAASAVELKLESCVEEQLSIRVGIATGSSGQVVGDAFKDVWLRAGEAGEVGWQVSAQEAGVLEVFGSVEVLVGRPSGELDETSATVGAVPERGLEFALSAAVFVKA